MSKAPTVYAFMDESGDPGGDIGRGASRHFILVLLETTQPELLQSELAQLRSALNVPMDFEFHFHNTRSTSRRAAFFILLRSLDVRVRAVIVEKGKLPPEGIKWAEQEMYEYALGEIIKNSLPSELSEAVLVIDGEARKQRFVNHLRTFISNLSKEQHRDRVFKTIVLKESEREDGLQFADMVAGVIGEIADHGESAYEAYVMSKVRFLLKLPK